MDNQIYKSTASILSELGAIEKTRRNSAQGYSFRGIDDLYNALNPLLAKHKVFCVPEILSVEREEKQSTKGGTLLYTIAKMKYTLIAEDGSSISGSTIGEAMDSGDKSANKAMSAAQKYFFLQVFCVPTEEPKDTENETHVVAQKPAPKKEIPATDPNKARIVALVKQLNPTITQGVQYSQYILQSTQLELTPENYEEIIGRLEVLVQEIQ